MRIVFIHGGNEQMASYRYRVKMPCEQLVKLGFDVSINSGEADIVIFSKPTHEDAILAERCKKDGTHVIVDFCDNHFKHPVYAGVYRKMLELADSIVCPTKTMAGIILKQSGKQVEIIGDPYEFEQQTPHANGYKMLWFGHQQNLPELTKWMKILAKEELRVVTGKNDKITGYSPWSLENLKAELEYANIALFPTSEQNDYKSPNRLINAVMSGCFAVCSIHPAYEEFKKMVWVGRLNVGIQWAKGYSHLTNDLVREAQEYIIQTYSPEIIGAKWGHLLDYISAREKNTGPAMSISMS
jgi:hypothetical protein